MESAKKAPSDGQRSGGDWVMLRVMVPPAWHRWLRESADAQATTVSAIVRSLIRALMIRRHDDEERPAA